MKKRKIRKTWKKRMRVIIGVSFLLVTVWGWSFWKNSNDNKGITKPYAHDYHWSHLDRSKMIYRYEDSRYYSRFGIDVSSHQGRIDWSKVKKAGVQFAYIRLGYRGYQNGGLHEDTTFRYNIEEALKQNISVGVYFFSQAINEKEAKEEADFVLKRIRSYSISLPIVYDLETVPEAKRQRIGLLTKEDRTKQAVAFIKNIQQNGYKAMTYSSTKIFANMYQLDVIQKYPVWVAEYDQVVKYPYQFQFWQYSHRGRINGINRYVDLNLQLIRK